MKPKLPTAAIRWTVGSLILGLLLTWLLRNPGSKSRPPIVTSETHADAKPAAHSTPVATSEIRRNADRIPLRPLTVTLKTSTHEWTEGDGSDLKYLLAISHNPDETIRMVEENERIKRRQLVYRNDTAAAAVQRARLSGEPIHHLTLPALDGQELNFEIDRADLAPSGQSGSFTGKLVGKPQSLVTLAFKFGRESFTVISPEDDLYLQADPREPGEIIVKSIDPDVYAAGQCGVVENSNHPEY